MLNAFGLPLLPTVLARTADEAAALAAVFGFPVVAKLQARGLLHKSDIGGVQVGLASERAVRSAFRELMAIAAEHEPVDPNERRRGRDPADGLGRGRNDDRHHRRSAVRAAGRVRTRRHSRRGARRRPLPHLRRSPTVTPMNCCAASAGTNCSRVTAAIRRSTSRRLRDLLLRVARLAEDVPDIAELDLNPVIALLAGQRLPHCGRAHSRVVAPLGDRPHPPDTPARRGGRDLR